MARKVYCALLVMCGVATVINGAFYEPVAPQGVFGGHYYILVPLPVRNDINRIDHQCPEKLYAIMQETGSIIKITK